MPERRSRRPWHRTHAPSRVLLIRFHAVGDVALVLPAAAHLARRWPEARIDMLTLSSAESLARAAAVFRNVLLFPDRSSRRGRFAQAIRTGLDLRHVKYDAIFDLQGNALSRIIRRISGAPAWSEFDRFSSLPASERVLTTISECGVRSPAHEIPFPLADGLLHSARRTLCGRGWDGSTRLVAFNPAGLWKTRNWPLQSYVELYGLWRAVEPVRILLLGTDRLHDAAVFLEREIGSDMINLAGHTTAGEAIAILRHADVIVTEDSGLMHMAWGAGTPVVALFGSSRADWSAPVGDRSVCFNSADLECGCCMEPVCRFGDVHCLTRHTPEAVFRAARGLMGKPAHHSQSTGT